MAKKQESGKKKLVRSSLKSDKMKSHKKESAKKIKKKDKQKSNKKATKSKKTKDNFSDDEEENNLKDKTLPGQKFPTPPAGDSTRAFYESLLEQRPDSLMALKYCIEYGCLDPKKAEEYNKILIKKKEKLKKH